MAKFVYKSNTINFACISPVHNKDFSQPSLFRVGIDQIGYYLLDIDKIVYIGHKV